MRKRSIFLLLTSFLLACNEQIDPPANEDLGFDFYPLEIDFFRIYEVDEIIYEISGFDTSHYFLRETIVDTFRTQGQLTYLLELDRTADTTLGWQTDSLVSMRRTENVLVVTRNNVQTVPLSFPVRIGESWDGNSFNSNASNNRIYEAIESFDLTVEPSLIADLDMVNVVIDDIPANIVNQNQQWEVYGKGVGLIEKKSIILDFCTVDCDSAGQIESGRFLSQQLIEYGRN